MNFLKILLSITFYGSVFIYPMDPIDITESITYPTDIHHTEYIITDIDNSNTDFNDYVNDLRATYPAVIEAVNEAGDRYVVCYTDIADYYADFGIDNPSHNNATNNNFDDGIQAQQGFAWSSRLEDMAYEREVQQRDKDSSWSETTSTSSTHSNQIDILLSHEKTFNKPYVDPIKTLEKHLRSPMYRKSLDVHREIFQKQLDDRWVTGKQPFKDKIAIIDAISDGSMTKALDTIKNGNLKDAIEAFDTLKNMYPWKDRVSFLVDGQAYSEKIFIGIIGIDIMKVAESSLIGRVDYIQTHIGVRLTALKRCYYVCRNNQLNGNRNYLKQRQLEIISKIKIISPRDTSYQRAQLVIVESLLSDSLTDILSNIKNTNLDIAEKELNSFHTQLIDYFKNEGFKSMNEAKADMLHQEGADVLAAANACYESRPDHRKEFIQQESGLFQNAFLQDTDASTIDAFDIVSTTISNCNVAITPEVNQRIGQVLNTLNDQSLKTFATHVDTLVAILKEQELDAEMHGKCIAVSLESCALRQKYTESPNKQIVAQPDINILVFNARKDAFAFIVHNPVACRGQSYKLNPEVCVALQSRGIDPKQFTYCVGNEAQQQLNAEFVDILNKMGEVELNTSTQPLFDLVITCTHTGNAYAQQNNLDKAFSLADCAWAALDCAKVIGKSGINTVITNVPEVAEGIVDGYVKAVCFIPNMTLYAVDKVIHPVQTMHDIRNAFTHLGTCLLNLADSFDVPNELPLEFTSEALDAHIQQGLDKHMQTFKENMNNVIETASQITVKGATSFVVETYLTGKIFSVGINFIKNYARLSATQLAKIGQAIDAKAQKLADKLGPKPVVVTTDGTKMTVVAQKETKILQSMEKIGETTKNIGAVEREFQPILKSVDGRSFLEIKHPVLDNIKTGSALKKDPFHAFNSIIDNFARYAKKFNLKGKDGIVRELYQIEGSLNGINGIFEWIVDPRVDRGVTHRLFIKNGTITGIPNVY